MEAALKNPRRPAPRQILCTDDRARLPWLAGLPVVTCLASDIANSLPSGAVHQGIAARIDPPESADLDALVETVHGTVLMLDQITDPQNIGALFRTAAAFGVRAIILQSRNCPPLGGTVAKAAAGGIDQVDHVEVTNLSRTLELFNDAGWVTVGLDGSAPALLDQADLGTARVLVLGSEGEGLRRLVAEHCDQLCRIDMPGGFESLNVAAAGAISVYIASGFRHSGE